MRRFLVALASFWIAAGAAFAADLGEFDYYGSNSGHLVLAASRAPSADISLVLSFRKVDGSDSGFISQAPPSKGLFGIESLDFESDGKRGNVTVRVLPPGDYEFVQFTAIEGQLVTRIPAKLPFTVKSGETTYLGTFHILAKLREPSVPMATGFYISFSNDLERDLPTAQKKKAGRLGPVSTAVPDVSSLNEPLFRNEPDPIVTSARSIAAYFEGRRALALPLEPPPSWKKLTPDGERAFANLTTAINAGDLWPYFLTDAYNLRGTIHASAGRLDEAIADFSQSISIQPSYATFSNRGAAYRERGEFDLAIADQTRALDLFPNYPVAYIRRATTHLAAKRPEMAIADVNEAIRLAPNNAYAYASRGAIHRVMGEMELAIADYSKAIDINRYVEIIHEHYNERGYLYLATNQFQKALADFDKILLNRSGTIDNYAGRCVALVGVGNAGRALKDCDKALGMDEKRSDVFHTRGLANFMSKQYSRALIDFSAAFDLDQHNWGALYGRGVARAKLGDIPNARSDMDEAQRMNPGIGATMAKFGVSP